MRWVIDCHDSIRPRPVLYLCIRISLDLGQEEILRLSWEVWVYVYVKKNLSLNLLFLFWIFSSPSPVISSTFQALHHTDIIIIRNFSEGGVKTKANVWMLLTLTLTLPMRWVIDCHDNIRPRPVLRIRIRISFFSESELNFLILITSTSYFFNTSTFQTIHHADIIRNFSKGGVKTKAKCLKIMSHP